MKGVTLSEIEKKNVKGVILTEAKKKMFQSFLYLISS